MTMPPFFQSLKHKVDHLSLKYKLFLLLVALSVIPIILVSYSSQYFMFRSSTKYSASISSQYVEFVSKDITNYLQDLNQSFDTLFTNFQFQKFLTTPDDDLAAQANLIIDFRPILKNSLQFRNEIVGVLYLDQLGKVYFDSYQKALNYRYSFRDDPIYGTVFSTTKPELTLPHAMDYILLGTHENVFSFVRPIINLNTGDIRSWFIVELREDKIKSMLTDASPEQEGQLLLYHAGSSTPVSNTPIDAALLQDFRKALEKDARTSKEFLFTSDGVTYEATYANIPYGDWKLVWMAPLSGITKGVQQSFVLTLIIAFVSLAIAIVIAFPVMNMVLWPLYKLKQGMQSLGRGTYVPIKMQTVNDEIGFLVRSYNRMLDELQQMEQEVFQSKLKEKERELLQLQAQINPHFLFNTLETIESYAVRNHGDAVGEMVQSVSKMMRFSVRNDGGWAPLKEEMAYIRNFMRIHYYRNGLDVNAHFELDPEALEIPIMKLSIQPFVENAIKYGWSPSMNAEEFLLTVEAKVEKEHLRISIRNTGAGIPADIMSKLSELMASKGERIDPYFQRHTGIYNVYRRFLLAYGDSIPFHIESTPGLGTLVEIAVPCNTPRTGK